MGRLRCRQRGLPPVRVLVLFTLLLVYNVNLRQVSSYDTYASRFVAISVLRSGDLDLDEFFADSATSGAPDGHVNDFLVRAAGRLYDSQPPVGPLLATPVYALPVLVGVPRDPVVVANLFSKLAASLMTALSALALFGAVRRAACWMEGSAAQVEWDVSSPGPGRLPRHDRVALAATLVYGLATSVWSTASQALWSHTPTVLGYAVSLWAISVGAFGVCGVAAGAAAVARPATAPAAALVVICACHVAWRRAAERGWASVAARAAIYRAVRAGLGVLAVGVAGVLYNQAIFGDWLGGATFRTDYWVRRLGAADMFSGSMLVGLAGLTVSPSRGLLVYSPIVIISLLGAWTVWRTRLPRLPVGRQGDAILLGRYASIAAVFVLLVYAKYLVWWGGHGFGPRYLTDGMPFVGLLLGFGFLRLPFFERANGATSPTGPSRGRFAGAAIAVGTLFVYSFAIQSIGAFCWPSPWTTQTPYYERLWQWSDSEIVDCVRAGPRIDPMARRLFVRIGLIPARKRRRAVRGTTTAKTPAGP